LSAELKKNALLQNVFLAIFPTGYFFGQCNILSVIFYSNLLDYEQLFFKGLHNSQTYTTHVHTLEYTSNQWKFGVGEVVYKNGASFSFDTCPEKPLVHEITELDYELNNEQDTGLSNLLQKYVSNGKTRYRV